MGSKVEITGKLGRDPEMRYAASGIAICKMSVGVKRKDEMDWFDVTCFGDVAEAAAGLTKGAYVQVKGRLQMDKWKDKQTGAPRNKVVIIAQEVAEKEWEGESKPKQVREEPAREEPLRSKKGPDVGPSPSHSDDIPF